ncbi:OmpA family protein [Fulvivirga maritima]|uniref:OmpA family protein n=1 Tax=Fulvivirga maritima TaxID=2904247 RepID=UPI001F2A0866|nr:OmpA family protein [Fulvivirga maritima]UII25666.1 OmpA family protein [Fulvivirga maritima]
MRRRVIGFLLIFQLLFALTSGYSQSHKFYLKRGKKYYKIGAYDRAIGDFKRAARIRKGNATITYHLGLAYLGAGDVDQALKNLEKVYLLNPKIDREITYYLGIAYQYQYDLEKAKKVFHIYKDLKKKNEAKALRKIKECDFGMASIAKKQNTEVRNLREPINSRYNDYAPIIDPKGRFLIFTSSRNGSTGGLRLTDGSYYEDIYISHKRNGQWDDPKKISPKINIKYHDAACSISPDGKTLYLYYERGGGNIYAATKENNLWSEPERMTDKINSVFWETSASITADGKTIYFSSDRPGGIGGLDIYRTDLRENGEWSTPVNLGPTINTNFSEDSPYISPDGKTLYFGSNGHTGMGGNDIYYSRVINGRYQEPVNMGYPINTVFNDNYFTISPDNKHGYYASSQPDGEGDADIYEIIFHEWPEGERPEVSPDVDPQVIARLEEEPTQQEEVSAPAREVEVEPEITVAKAEPEETKTTAEPETPVIDTKEEVAVVTPKTTSPTTVQEKPKEDKEPVVEQEPEVEEEIEVEEQVAQVETPRQEVQEPEPEPEEEKSAPLAVEKPFVDEVQSPVAQVAVPSAEEAEVIEKASVKYFDEDFINEQKEKGVVTILKGKVIDAGDAKPLYATMKLIDNESNTILAEVKSDPVSGDFELIIPHGGNYGVTTTRLGYLFNSINFSIPKNTEMPELDTHILLQKAEVGSKVILKNIFFDTGKSDLRTESLAELFQIRSLLSENPKMTVQINGHTDNIGNAVYNKVLSKKRAQSVVDYLISHNIDPNRLSAKGFGEERPLVSNDDEEDGREINRRTEIEIISVDNSIAGN